MNKTEQRIIRYHDTVLRAADGGDMLVEGYALKFDKLTQIGSDKWGWMEKIAKTALDGAKLDDVVFNFNHNLDHMLSRTTNRSLTLIRDAIGLKMEARIVDTATGRDVYKLIQDGLIARMSFAAIIKTSVWTISEDDSQLDMREITAFERLFDVSAVTFPAYEDTSIQARGLIADDEVKRHFDQRKYQEQIQKLNKILGGTK